jgi:hypothetical protein
MTESKTSISNTNEAPWRSSIRAAKANLVPGLVLWSIGFVLVLGYYKSPFVHAGFEYLNFIRSKIGLLFPILITALCGGFLPFLYLRQNAQLRSEYQLKNCIFLLLFWSYKGLEIEAWYRLQAIIFGPSTHVFTVFLKMLCDQFIYCPLFAVPLTVLGVMFNHSGLKLSPILADIKSGGWYRRTILPTLIANLIIWVPVVCLVYSLPLQLQIVLFNLVLVFFILIVTHIEREKQKK